MDEQENKEEMTDAAAENKAEPENTPPAGDSEAEAPQDNNQQQDNNKKKKEHHESAQKQEIESLKAQLADANDKYLRMLAEYDNFRRRSAKEREGVWASAVSDTIKELLPIADNLERAQAAEGDADTIRRGLEMTMGAMNDMLKKLGVEAFGAAGEDFDPAIHNAVMHVEDESLGENKIAEVFQRGYRIGDKVVRFAMVKVAN